MSTTRRSFLAMSAMVPFALKAFAASKSIPVGLELYSVRNELTKNLESTVTAVAKMGYQCVEFYGPYFEWTESQTKQYRKLIDDLGIKCYSTHNDQKNFNADNINKARDMNLILGSKYVVMSSAKVDPSVDGWKKLAETLNSAADTLAPSGLKPGYHNHQPEWIKMGDTFPLEVLAKNTKPSVMMQLDVGTCLESGGDPVAWIKANPGRIHSIHCKDWSPDPDKGYKVLFGEGKADWKGIFATAESVGGVEYYLVEQEGSRYSELETAEKCLGTFNNVHRA
ncbi:MAG TPA: sugar phosphate isomerase/epimerase family protein [Terriglobales bacterium]|nr:sugar phosphate isomerase/epimerase family protein [Terriglobales bacterium]